MLVFEDILSLKKHLRGAKTPIGFVPTMGALHKGHVSLIEKAKAETGTVVCSIFVNPTQFNDPKDLEKYPRTLDADKKMLIDAGCDVLFVPSVDEVYPKQQQQSHLAVDLGNLEKVMESAQRPGHFKGVIQVVSRLFDIVEPDKSYFGQKDFQQLAVIREMVRQMEYKTEIISCPIIREADGLAMSSRNVRLSPEERKIAPLIFKTLSEVKKNSQDVRIKSQDLIDYASKQIKSCKEMTLEYFEIADAKTLLPVKSLSDAVEVVACIAVKLGQIRLIDNIILK